MISRPCGEGVVVNSPRMKEALRRTFDKLMAMSDEELKAAMESAPDTGFGRMMIESGAHKLLMERIGAEEHF